MFLLSWLQLQSLSEARNIGMQILITYVILCSILKLVHLFYNFQGAEMIQYAHLSLFIISVSTADEMYRGRRRRRRRGRPATIYAYTRFFPSFPKS